MNARLAIGGLELAALAGCAVTAPRVVADGDKLTLDEGTAAQAARAFAILLE